MTRDIERKTYIRGEIRGEFIGHLNPRMSNLSHEIFYDLELIRGTISALWDSEHVKHFEDGEFEEFKDVSQTIVSFPDRIRLNLSNPSGVLRSFFIHLREPKLKSFKLSNQTHENRKVYGDIIGEVSGYIVHHEKVTEFVDEPTISIPTKTDVRSGKKQSKSNYERWEFLYSDGATYWGPWFYAGAKEKRSMWRYIGNIFGILLFLIIGLPLILLGWSVFIPVALIVGLVYVLVTFFNSLSEAVPIAAGGIGLLSVIGIFLSLYTNITHHSRDNNPNLELHDPSEVTQIIDFMDEDTTTLGRPGYSRGTKREFIKHHRVWEDYSGNTYEGDILISVNDFKDSNRFRNQLTSLNGRDAYEQLTNFLIVHDNDKLDSLTTMLASLREKHRLGQVEFTKVITSMIQDIPYTLLVQNECDPALYDIDFVKQYLNDGGNCAGNVRYGIYSPVEFMATLDGDCDTRALLLYHLLTKFGYEVMMFKSDYHAHALLGINLPIPGTAKIVNGTRYVFWETTKKGREPGDVPYLDREIDYWYPVLLNQNHII